MGQTIKVKKHDRGIGNHLEAVSQWENYRGRISCGEYFIEVDGVWMSQKEFDKEYPKPFVVDFLGDATNPDSTKNYLHK